VAAPQPLSRLESALRRLAGDLDELGRRWALVGGLAVSARAEPRFTRDVDVAVLVASDLDAERLVHSLQARGYRVRGVVEQEATRRLAAARLLGPGEDDGGVVIDTLFASSGIEPEIVSEAEALEVLPGCRVPVATLAHLVALKVLARNDVTRPMDRADLNALLRTTTSADLARTREALGLIAARGFQRGRRLDTELEQLLRERPPRNGP
jgi:hypothetical protein